MTSEFAPAFRIAQRAGLIAVPHGGELCGPATVGTCVDELGANRLGHGVRTGEDPALLARMVDAGIALEVCPASNVSLGAYRQASDVPLRDLFDAGARIALGADDPLLFGSRLTEQYEAARAVHGFTDDELASLARSSVLAATAPPGIRSALLTDIDHWLAPTPIHSQPTAHLRCEQLPEHLLGP